MSPTPIPFAVVRDLCQAQGLSALASIRPPHFFDPAPFDQLIADGIGDMTWLIEHRDMRLNPLSLLPTAQSMIVVACPYQPTLISDGLRSARYAAGKDYHALLRKKLSTVGKALASHGGQAWKQRAAVDSAPINERTLARIAGLGWIGRNALLISPTEGSYRFIGVLLTEAPIEMKQGPHGANRCGSCTRCVTACPTKALVDGRVISERCISYLTIEHKGVIPRHLAIHFAGWWYGCDICQEVCPWNRFAGPAADPRLTGSDDDKKLLAINAITFDTVFAGRPIRRIGYERFRRNLLVALTSLGRIDECRPLVIEALPLVIAQAQELKLSLTEV